MPAAIATLGRRALAGHLRPLVRTVGWTLGRRLYLADRPTRGRELEHRPTNWSFDEGATSLGLRNGSVQADLNGVTGSKSPHPIEPSPKLPTRV